MKKLFGSLPFRLLLGIAIGIVCGLAFGEGVMKVIVTLKYIMGQLITFCVPLIVIGFIAPSITKLGSNASHLLGVAVAIAYISSIGAAFMSMAAGYGIVPMLSIDNSVEGLPAGYSPDHARYERSGHLHPAGSGCDLDQVSAFHRAAG